MTPVYPIKYRTIPTQYAFFVSKEGGKYRVQVRATRDLDERTFTTEQEARQYINQKRII